MAGYTHKQLVNVARKWLTRRNVVVVTELACGSENADALGFRRDGHTTLVECKATRADFAGDRRKFFRQVPALGMGAERYYLTPAGLVGEGEVPDGWGLLTWDGRRVRVVRESALFAERSHDRESRTLLSLLRRCARPNFYGASIRCYSFDIYKETKNRATLGIQRADGEVSA